MKPVKNTGINVGDVITHRQWMNGYYGDQIWYQVVYIDGEHLAFEGFLSHSYPLNEDWIRKEDYETGKK